MQIKCVFHYAPHAIVNFIAHIISNIIVHFITNKIKMHLLAVLSARVLTTKFYNYSHPNTHV